MQVISHDLLEPQSHQGIALGELCVFSQYSLLVWLMARIANNWSLIDMPPLLTNAR